MKDFLGRIGVMVALSAGFSLMVAMPVQAVDVLEEACRNNPSATMCQENQDEDINSNRIYGPNGIITAAAQTIALVVGIASVVMIIIAGIQYTVSSGDPSKINNAKDTLIYALIGLAIALLAQAIIVFILGRI